MEERGNSPGLAILAHSSVAWSTALRSTLPRHLPGWPRSSRQSGRSKLQFRISGTRDLSAQFRSLLPHTDIRAKLALVAGLWLGSESCSGSAPMGRFVGKLEVVRAADW